MTAMTYTKYRVASCLLLISLFFSGCAAKEITDETKTKSEGTALGTAGGIAARSLLGSVIGGKRRARYGYALEAFLGSCSGYMLGDTIAERKRGYIQEEDRLEGEIKVFSQQNDQLKTYNATTSKEITALQKRLAEIEHQKEKAQRQRTFSAREVEFYARRVEIDQSNTAKLAAELAGLEAYLRSIQGSGDQSGVAALRQEMERLQQHAAALESNSRQMARLVAAMPVRN